MTFITKYTVKVRKPGEVNYIKFEAHKVGVSDYGEYTRTLYETPDGRLLVYEVGHRYGIRDSESSWNFFEVTPEDLKDSGKYAELGKDSGYVPPMSLDEGLNWIEQGRNYHATN